MNLVVEVQRSAGDEAAPEDALFEQAARAAQQAAHDARGGFDGDRLVCINIVDAGASRSLNAEWRGRDKATNVLAFPAGDTPVAPGEPVPAGDLVICASVVADEAREQHKPADAHWAHMVVHGCLHLMGYDHMEDQAAEAMEDIERQALARLGFADPYRVHDG